MTVTPRIKVCGLTRPDQALACARLGVDAVGLVFHPQSPRHLEVDQAARISRILPQGVWAVGVVVDKDYDAIMGLAAKCSLDAVQLHGRESAVLVRRLENNGLAVIKALFAARRPFLAQAQEYAGCHGLLAECGRGSLPGGNAMAWDWSAAASLSRTTPLILAGGLGPGNLEQAVAAALPDAVDASSALESAPGIKDLARVEAFVAAVRCCGPIYRSAGRKPRPVFGRPWGRPSF